MKKFLQSLNLIELVGVFKKTWKWAWNRYKREGDWRAIGAAKLYIGLVINKENMKKTEVDRDLKGPLPPVKLYRLVTELFADVFINGYERSRAVNNTLELARFVREMNELDIREKRWVLKHYMVELETVLGWGGVSKGWGDWGE